MAAKDSTKRIKVEPGTLCAGEFRTLPDYLPGPDIDTDPRVQARRADLLLARNARHKIIDLLRTGKLSPDSISAAGRAAIVSSAAIERLLDDRLDYETAKRLVAGDPGTFDSNFSLSAPDHATAEPQRPVAV